MRATLLLLLLTLQPQDPPDPTVEEIIDRMEKAAAPGRGTIFIATTERGQSAEIAVAKDGTMRILEPLPDARPAISYRLHEMVLTADAVYDLVEEWTSLPNLSSRSGLARCAQKIARANCDRVDPFTERWGTASFQTWFWHLYFYALSPRMALGYERGLRLAGRRRLD